MHCAETMAGDKPLPQAISPSAGTLYCSGQEPLLRTREPSDFITSGFTPDEHRAMEGWWGGLWLIGHRAGSRRRCARPCRRLDSLAWLCALPGPLRRVRGCPRCDRAVVGFFPATKAEREVHGRRRKDAGAAHAAGRCDAGHWARCPADRRDRNEIRGRRRGL